MILQSIFTWAPMVLIALLNGILRKSWYSKHLDELRTHQASTASGLLLFSIYIWAVINLWPLESAQQAWMMGFIWLGLTVGFEFFLAHYGTRHSWERFLHDYNLFAGRLWPLIPFWLTVAPYVFYRLGN